METSLLKTLAGKGQTTVAKTNKGVDHILTYER